MSAHAAARLGDEIVHGFGLAAMVAGAVAGALVGAAVIAATAATGGVAAVIVAGAVAAGGLSMFQIVKGISTIFNIPEPTTGKLIRGSPDVFANRRRAMRAGPDMSGSCTGLPFNHPSWPFPVTIAEGSATVRINGKPAARVTSKLVCGAHIKSGSPDVFIGGATEATGFVFDLEGWAHTGLEWLGYAALASGAVLAAMAGGAAFLGFVAVTVGMDLAFTGLGLLGDRLGPGYGDLLQGVAGMALLLASPKIVGKSKPEKSPLPEEFPPRTPRAVDAADKAEAAYNQTIGELTGRGGLMSARDRPAVLSVMTKKAATDGTNPPTAVGITMVKGEGNTKNPIYNQVIMDRIKGRMQERLGPDYNVTTEPMDTSPKNGFRLEALKPDGTDYKGSSATCAEPRVVNGARQTGGEPEGMDTRWVGKGRNPWPLDEPDPARPNQMKPCPSCEVNQGRMMRHARGDD